MLYGLSQAHSAKRTPPGYGNYQNSLYSMMDPGSEYMAGIFDGGGGMQGGMGPGGGMPPQMMGPPMGMGAPMGGNMPMGNGMGMHMGTGMGGMPRDPGMGGVPQHAMGMGMGMMHPMGPGPMHQEGHMGQQQHPNPQNAGNMMNGNLARKRKRLISNSAGPMAPSKKKTSPTGDAYLLEGGGRPPTQYSLERRRAQLRQEGIEYSGTTVAPVRVEVQQHLLGPETGLEDGHKCRDENAKMEERMGVLHFKVISNNGTKQNSRWLVEVKTVISIQLPKMPREYICRLVFDWNHKSLLLMKQDKVIGGIVFRPFYEQGFLEIAFCAVTSAEQVKGYGTHLMNHLKEYAKQEKVYHFLTYADNGAIEYFKKQGFTREVILDRSKWIGFIKDYDGGTPMECVIYPNVDYLDVPSVVKRQREVVTEKIKEISKNSHIIHPGLKVFRKGGGGKRINISDIPGIHDSTFKFNPGVFTAAESVDSLQAVLRDVIVNIRQHPSAWPFREPVDGKEVPDYYKVITDPIDLKTIQRRLEAGNYYITREIFLADIKRMCNNCRTYNAKETVYYKCADDLEKFINEIFFSNNPASPWERPKRQAKENALKFV